MNLLGWIWPRHSGHVTSPLTRIVDRLDALIAKHNARIGKNQERISKLLTKNDALDADAARAAKVSAALTDVLHV